MKTPKGSKGAPAKSTGTFNVSAGSITRLGGGRPAKQQPGSKKGNAGSFGAPGNGFFENMRGKRA